LQDKKPLPTMTDKNPVAIYGFGGRLDEDFKLLQKDDKPWTKDDWASWLNLDLKHWVLDDLSPEGKILFRKHAGFEADKADKGDKADKTAATVDWAQAWLKLTEAEAIPTGLSEDDQKTLKSKREKLPKKLEIRAQLLNATNLGE